MRKTLFLLAIAVVVVCPQSIFGQQPAIAQLFTNQEMQAQFVDDMQLTDDQSSQLGQLGGEFRREMELLFREYGPQMMSEENRMEALDKIRAEGMKLSEGLKEKMRGVLTEKQYTKLEERTFQLTGGTRGLLFSVGLGDTLQLTPEQVKKVEALQRQMMTELFQLVSKMQGASGEEQARIRSQIEELVAKYTKLAEDILTTEQKVKAEKLVEDTPDYIWSRLPENRGRTREWRPGANSWQPGQGAPEGGNPNSETRPTRQRGERTFPGSP
ncbi:MAG: DUF3654 domain-containing protein [Planctomycetaceae bacterium]|nr:DUF3654 domain-containing protein [Planctomycetaceae bacterium]